MPCISPTTADPGVLLGLRLGNGQLSRGVRGGSNVHHKHDFGEDNDETMTCDEGVRDLGGHLYCYRFMKIM